LRIADDGDNMPREFELILWGATGFTGRLTAHYVQKHYAGQLRWAIAGRNKEKLSALQKELQTLHSDVPSICIGDASDDVSLRQLVARTDVICSTVGPYARYGSPLVAACVEEGTDYCDLTGESTWIRKMIDMHHDTAQEKGTRIVHCCGFDSIPSDLGVLLLQEESIKQLGKPQTDVTFYVGKTKGGFSGGTVASMMLLMEDVKDPKVRKILGNPYALNPKDGFRGPDKRDQQSVRYDPKIQSWTGPFIMAGINTRIVRRSHALLDYRYGKDFSYREVMSLPKGGRGWLMGMMITLGLGGFLFAASVRPIRTHILSRFLPKPGEGPDQETRENGYFNISIRGETAHVKVKGFQDPGYGETSKMLAEAALCLVKDHTLLQSSGGVLTPATAMGEVLLERLRKAGMVFSFHID